MRVIDITGKYSLKIFLRMAGLAIFILMVNLFLVLPSFAKTVGITVIINPEEVRPSARFTIEGQSYQSGETALVEGKTNYVVSFSEVNGWRAPADAVISVWQQDITYSGNSTYERLEDVPEIVINDTSKWPLWPRQSSNANVWEPYSFTSIGRDVVSWVTFSPMEGNTFFWLSDLRVIVRTGELAYSRVNPNFNSVGQTYEYIAENTLKAFPSTLGDILGDLRDYAVIPSYMENWMTLTENDVSQDYPNQDFDSSWFSFSGWMDFLRGEAGFELEDSGHAPYPNVGRG